MVFPLLKCCLKDGFEAFVDFGGVGDVVEAAERRGVEGADVVF